MKQKKTDTFKWKILLVVVITIVASTALTYGFFTASKRQTGQNDVISGCFNVQLVDETASINLSNSYSISDAEGKKTPPYSFGITNTCDIEASYYIVIDIKDNSFGSDHINVMIDDENPKALNSYALNTSYPAESGYGSSYVLKRGTLAKGEKDTFEVRAWINGSATYEDVSGKSFEAQVRVINVVKDVDYGMTPSGQTLAKLGVKSKGTMANFAEISPLTQYQDDNFNRSTIKYGMTSFKTNYITYADSYTFDINNGTYTLINPQVCQYQNCYTTLIGKYTPSVQGSRTNAVEASSNLYSISKVKEETTVDSVAYVMSSKTQVGYDYSKDGIYEMEDDYGISYYYRGAVENNYIKFGKYGKDVYFGNYSSSSTDYKTYSSLEECNNSTNYNTNCRIGIAKGTDMYWRIIRINGDGSIRIIYDGTSPHANGESNMDRFAMSGVPWNATNRNDAKYVGYMYGGVNGEASTSKEHAQTNETSSNIKVQLEQWYKDNIEDTGYSNAVSDEVFCNDRSFARNNMGAGFGTSLTYFGSYGRLIKSNPQPSFKCPEKNDSFTKDDTAKGNGMLEYPVGLITADELMAAGSGEYNSKNIKYYLYKGSTNEYWTLSPYSSESLFYGLSTGTSYVVYVNHAESAAPVINLSKEFIDEMIGTGTMTDPYRSPQE